jgi:hypothetical protein
MLAELFMCRLEAVARLSQNQISATGRFVPFNPATPIEFKNKRVVADHRADAATITTPPDTKARGEEAIE